MILTLWILCTAFLAWFLLTQLPEVFQDLSLGVVVVAVVLLWWAP